MLLHHHQLLQCHRFYCQCYLDNNLDKFIDSYQSTTDIPLGYNQEPEPLDLWSATQDMVEHIVYKVA